MPFPAIDLTRVRTVSLAGRPSRVAVSDLITPAAPLPEFDSPDLAEICERIVAARQAGAPLIWMFGAHVVKRGLAPLLVDLMERGWITHLASNGAAAIHDFEFAFNGGTSEDVASSLEDGTFGMAEETGAGMNRAIQAGARDGLGLGEALGRWIAGHDFPYRETSLLYHAFRLGVPYTVHVAIGTDIIHQHPEADFAAIGWASGQDFKIFTHAVSELEGGVFCNFGSAVIGPEVFLKALSIARNLGHTVKVFTTANFDLIQMEDYHRPISDEDPEYYYRPRKNIVNRPVSLGGRGYHVCGDHRQTIPHLAARLRAAPVQPRAAAWSAPESSAAGLLAPHPRALGFLAQAGEAWPAVKAQEMDLARAFQALLPPLRCGGTLFIAGEIGILSRPGSLPGGPLPASLRCRLEAQPGGAGLAACLESGLRLAVLGCDAPIAARSLPPVFCQAQELYRLARPGDALLCLEPGRETPELAALRPVAGLINLPVAVLSPHAGASPQEARTRLDRLFRCLAGMLAEELLAS